MTDDSREWPGDTNKNDIKIWVYEIRWVEPIWKVTERKVGCWSGERI